jgi:hypothetical protein
MCWAMTVNCAHATKNSLDTKVCDASHVSTFLRVCPVVTQVHTSAAARRHGRIQGSFKGGPQHTKALLQVRRRQQSRVARLGGTSRKPRRAQAALSALGWTAPQSVDGHARVMICVAKQLAGVYGVILKPLPCSTAPAPGHGSACRQEVLGRAPCWQAGPYTGVEPAGVIVPTAGVLCVRDMPGACHNVLRSIR